MPGREIFEGSIYPEGIEAMQHYAEELEIASRGAMLRNEKNARRHAHKLGQIFGSVSNDLKQDIRSFDRLLTRFTIRPIRRLQRKILTLQGVLGGFFAYAESRARKMMVLQKSIEHISMTTGRNVSSILSMIERNVDATTKKMDLMQGTMRLLGTSLSTEQIETFIKQVKDGSRVMGYDFNDAIQLVSRGFRQLNPNILDNIGVNFRLDQVLNSAARRLGKTARELDNTAKEQAVFNEMVKQGLSYQGIQSMLLEENLLGWERFSRIREKIIQSIGAAAAPGFQDLYNNLSKLWELLYEIVSSPMMQLVIKWLVKLQSILFSIVIALGLLISPLKGFTMLLKGVMLVGFLAFMARLTNYMGTAVFGVEKWTAATDKLKIALSGLGRMSPTLAGLGRGFLTGAGRGGPTVGGRGAAIGAFLEQQLEISAEAETYDALMNYRRSMYDVAKKGFKGKIDKTTLSRIAKIAGGIGMEHMGAEYIRSAEPAIRGMMAEVSEMPRFWDTIFKRKPRPLGESRLFREGTKMSRLLGPDLYSDFVNRVTWGLTREIAGGVAKGIKSGFVGGWQGIINFARGKKLRSQLGMTLTGRFMPVNKEQIAAFMGGTPQDYMKEITALQDKITAAGGIFGKVLGAEGAPEVLSRLFGSMYERLDMMPEGLDEAMEHTKKIQELLSKPMPTKGTKEYRDYVKSIKTEAESINDIFTKMGMRVSDMSAHLRGFLDNIIKNITSASTNYQLMGKYITRLGEGIDTKGFIKIEDTISNIRAMVTDTAFKAIGELSPEFKVGYKALAEAIDDYDKAIEAQRTADDPVKAQEDIRRAAEGVRNKMLELRVATQKSIKPMQEMRAAAKEFLQPISNIVSAWQEVDQMMIHVAKGKGMEYFKRTLGILATGAWGVVKAFNAILWSLGKMVIFMAALRIAFGIWSYYSKKESDTIKKMKEDLAAVKRGFKNAEEEAAVLKKTIGDTKLIPLERRRILMGMTPEEFSKVVAASKVLGKSMDDMYDILIRQERGGIFQGGFNIAEKFKLGFSRFTMQFQGFQREYEQMMEVEPRIVTGTAVNQINILQRALVSLHDVPGISSLRQQETIARTLIALFTYLDLPKQRAQMVKFWRSITSEIKNIQTALSGAKISDWMAALGVDEVIGAIITLKTYKDEIKGIPETIEKLHKDLSRIRERQLEIDAEVEIDEKDAQATYDEFHRAVKDWGRVEFGIDFSERDAKMMADIWESMNKNLRGIDPKLFNYNEAMIAYTSHEVGQIGMGITRRQKANLAMGRELKRIYEEHGQALQNVGTAHGKIGISVAEIVQGYVKYGKQVATIADRQNDVLKHEAERGRLLDEESEKLAEIRAAEESFAEITKKRTEAAKTLANAYNAVLTVVIKTHDTMAEIIGLVRKAKGYITGKLFPGFEDPFYEYETLIMQLEEKRQAFEAIMGTPIKEFATMGDRAREVMEKNIFGDPMLGEHIIERGQSLLSALSEVYERGFELGMPMDDIKRDMLAVADILEITGTTKLGKQAQYLVNLRAVYEDVAKPVIDKMHDATFLLTGAFAQGASVADSLDLAAKHFADVIPGLEKTIGVFQDIFTSEAFKKATEGIKFGEAAEKLSKVIDEATQTIRKQLPPAIGIGREEALNKLNDMPELIHSISEQSESNIELANAVKNLVAQYTNDINITGSAEIILKDERGNQLGATELHITTTNLPISGD